MRKSDLNYKSYEPKHDLRGLPILIIVLLGIAFVLFLFLLVPTTYYDPTNFLKKAKTRIENVDDNAQTLDEAMDTIER